MIKIPTIFRIPTLKQSLNIQKASYPFKQRRIKSSWGLDISGHALKAAKIVLTSGELFIEDIDIIEYPALPPDINIFQSPCIKDAIQTFLTKHRIAKTDKVLVSIPGQLVLSRFITVPPVDKKQLKNIVNYEAKQQIPFDLKDIVWDFQQLSEKIPGAENIEVGLFASKRTTLDQILTNISSINPNLAALQVSPLAISNFVLFDQQVDGPTIIINVETENTDLLIIDGPHLWLRSIPLSTVDADLVKEIQRSMEYYKSLTKEEVHFKTLFLMGSRFKDPLNVKFISDNFTYDLKILKTLNNIKLSGKIDSTFLNETLLNFGVAFGLSLQGLGLGRININLLPQKLIKATEISKKKPYAIVTVGCLALALIIQYFGLHIRINRLINSAEYHQKVLENIKKVEREYKNAETHAQANESALNFISSIDLSRFFWVEILDKLLSLMPNNVTITSINTSWIETSTIKTEGMSKQTSPGFFQTKKTAATAKQGYSQKSLIMGLKGESKEPRMGFIEEFVLKPIQNLTLFEQKVPAFKNAEIVPGTCRQIVSKDNHEESISFEIRWIVKSHEEIQEEMKSLLFAPGTPTPFVKS